MVKNVKVSIIVPVYNAENRLRICLDSLIKQTLRDLEIIIIDDGSTDQSGNICDQYVHQDKRVKVFHINNGGPARARNIGIQKANGLYLGFVDADDRVELNMFEYLINEACNFDSDICICNYFLENDKEDREVKFRFEKFYNNSSEIKNKLLYKYYSDDADGLYSVCNKIIKRDFILDNNIVFDESLVRAEDAWFVFDCLKVADTVVFSQKCLYHYYQNPASIMHTIRFDQYEKWVQTRTRLLEENTALKFDINYAKFYAGFLYKISVYCRDLIKIGEKERVKDILADSFYRNASQYTSELPIHIKFLHNVARKNKIRIAIMCYCIWGWIGK